MPDKKRVPLLSAAAGVLVLCLGFLALLAFWSLGPQNPSLPGLFDYAAATWGDGLFLPIAATGGVGWLLSAALSVPHARLRLARAVGVGSAVVAGAVGLLVQLSWLASDSTSPNWTIPQPHVFTPAGWWHAGFFVLAFALLFGLLGFYLASLRVVHAAGLGIGRSQGLYEMLIWLGGLCYAQMHVIDDHASLLPQPWLCLLVAAVALVALIVSEMVLVPRGCQYSRFWRCLPAVIACCGTGLAVGYPPSDPIVASLAVALVVGFVLNGLVLVRPSRSIVDVLLEAGYVTVANVGLALSLVSLGSHLHTWSLDTESILVLAVAAALLVLVIVSGDRRQLAVEKTGGALGLPIYIGATMLCLLSVSGPLPPVANQVIQFVLDAALVTGSISKARGDTARVQSQERGPDGGFAIRNSTYTLFAFEFMGLLLLVIVGVLITNGDSVGAVGLPRSPYLLWLLLPPALSSVVSMRVRGKVAPALRVALLAVGYAGLALLSSGLRRPLISGFVWVLLAVILAVFVSCFLAESYLSNCYTLHGRAVEPEGRVCSLVMFAGCFAVTLLSVLPTEQAGREVLPTLFSPLSGGIVVATAYIVLPLSLSLGDASRRVDAGPGPFMLGVGSPWEGVLQNGMAASAVTFFFGILLFECGYALGVLQQDPNMLLGTAGLASVVFVLVAGNMGAALFPLSMNAGHLRDVVGRYDALSSADRDLAEASLRSLARHLGRQAVATVAMLLPWSLIPLVCQRFRCADMASWRSVLLRRYLLVLDPHDFAQLFGELVGRSGQSGESDVARLVIDAARRGKPKDDEEE